MLQFPYALSTRSRVGARLVIAVAVVGLLGVWFLTHSLGAGADEPLRLDASSVPYAAEISDPWAAMAIATAELEAIVDRLAFPEHPLPPGNTGRPAPKVPSGSVWDRLAWCESRGNWAHPTVDGLYSGGLQFHHGTWRSAGGTEFAPRADLATREQQIAIAERVLASSGWKAWPACTRQMGLR